MPTHRRTVEHTDANWYATPEWATHALLDKVQFDGAILEPCCGDGAISKVLVSRGLFVVSQDLHDRGYGAVKDFLQETAKWPTIITNPPYERGLTEKIILHALSLATSKVAMLVRLAFLEGQRRYDTIFKPYPPMQVLVFSERLSMFPGGDTRTHGGTTAYAWIVWDNSSQQRDRGICLDWIPPGIRKKYT